VIKKKGKRKTRKPVAQPLSPDLGLSSKINRTWAITVLSKSSPVEIASVLREIGYEIPPDSAVSSGDIDNAIGREVEAFLRSFEGQEHLRRSKEEALNREVQKWLRGKQGKAQLKRMKIARLADEFEKDGIEFHSACRAEIKRRVQCWLDSPAGEEAIEQARHRARLAVIEHRRT
jgi:hypothetical protein